MSRKEKIAWPGPERSLKKYATDMSIVFKRGVSATWKVNIVNQISFL